ncbi:MAG TPA: GAF domain-containing protein [Candidatus Binatia bacterium]|nr:GAF domain-containing protein [Candidatus Binatia bacterium]
MNSPIRFPGEDGGRTLAEMAQRDLDAALQLLADRAQFITGASGAAIALRCDGRNDMLCRASAGSNAPELGALLSTEFGLSGESVRTRQLLRCDDAARDARVNQEACRQLGIASVVVMPVVSDEEVLGVFELFSGQANAFGDRDLSAVQRLTEMVETAVRLANASLSLPQQLKQAQPPAQIQGSLEKKSAAEKTEPAKIEETSGNVLDDEILLEAIEVPVAQNAMPWPTGQSPSLSLSASSALSLDPGADDIIETIPAAGPKDPAAKPAEVAPVETSGSNDGKTAAGTGADIPVGGIDDAKKPVLWSATNAEADAEKSGPADQSHVPPVLRGLRKCAACGFPISGGRTFCVECEEKKWRGQLVQKQQAPTAMPRISKAPRKPEGQAFGAAASAPALAPVTGRVAAPQATSAELKPFPEMETPVPEAYAPGSTEEPGLVLSAGLQPSQSWVARNKYVVGIVLVVAAAITAVLLLR